MSPIQNPTTFQGSHPLRPTSLVQACQKRIGAILTYYLSNQSSHYMPMSSFPLGDADLKEVLKYVHPFLKANPKVIDLRYFPKATGAFIEDILTQCPRWHIINFADNAQASDLTIEDEHDSTSRFFTHSTLLKRQFTFFVPLLSGNYEERETYGTISLPEEDLKCLRILTTENWRDIENLRECCELLESTHYYGYTGDKTPLFSRFNHYLGELKIEDFDLMHQREYSIGLEAMRLLDATFVTLIGEDKKALPPLLKKYDLPQNAEGLAQLKALPFFQWALANPHYASCSLLARETL